MGLQPTLDTALIGIVIFHPEQDKHFNNIFRKNTIHKWLPSRRNGWGVQAQPPYIPTKEEWTNYTGPATVYSFTQREICGLGSSNLNIVKRYKVLKHISEQQSIFSIERCSVKINRWIPTNPCPCCSIIHGWSMKSCKTCNPPTTWIIVS